jgi:hypothetical protein
MTSLLRRRVTLLSVMLALFGALLMIPGSAYAALYTFGCKQNTDCAAGEACTERLNLFVVRFTACRPIPCNSDVDCDGATLCQGGVCSTACNAATDCKPGFTCSNAMCKATPQTPVPGGIPGEGRKCNPPDGSKPADWALDSNGKPLGACPQGTACNHNGFCQKPLQ